MQYSLEVSITNSGDMQIPVKVKERHFIDDYEPERAIVQAIGRELLISIWSPRDMIQIGLPLTEWFTEKSYGRSLSSGRVALERWQPRLDCFEDGGTTKTEATVYVFDPTQYKPIHPENQ